MIFNILNRYPNMRIEDIELRGNGQDIEITKWNSDEPIPSMDDVWKWIEEDDKKSIISPPLSTEDINKQDISVLGETVSYVLDDTTTLAETLALVLNKLEKLEVETYKLKGE